MISTAVYRIRAEKVLKDEGYEKVTMKTTVFQKWARLRRVTRMRAMRK